MTTLSAGKPLRRETALYYRGRPLLVELHPGYLTLREKGRRFTFSVDYQAILELVYKIKHRADQAEKRKKRRSSK
jgi:hypothetical protein